MVNPAITAALLAAANQEEMEKKVEGRLKKAGAVSQARAIALELKDKEGKLLDEALASGTVKRTEDGRFYLNERVISDRKEGQGFMALLIVLVLLSVMASVAILAAQASN